MNTARIVVLTTAEGAGGIAAYLASRSDDTPLAAEPVARLAAMERVEADGAGFMAAVLHTGIRPPSLTKTLK